MDNSLTELDISHCPDLETLDCRDNKITALDVSKCTKLDNPSYDDGVQIIEAAAAPVITTSSLPSGTVGEAYPSTALEAAGTTPVKWSWSGNYPSGLTLSEAGIITGTPVKEGDV